MSLDENLEGMDEHHEHLMRRYIKSMRDLLSLSKSEYVRERKRTKYPVEESDTYSNQNQSRHPGPPLTPLSIAYAQTNVTTTRRVFSWAVPTTEALDVISDFSQRGVVEIGAGTGLWTSLLRKRGVHVDAIDAVPMDSNGVDDVDDGIVNGHHGISNENPPPFADVRRGDVDALTSHTGGLSLDGNNVPAMLLCWPPREEGCDHPSSEDNDNKTPFDVTGMALDALNGYRGNTVLYVGETCSSNGQSNTATAGPLFHEKLREEWNLTRNVPLPNWPGTSDSLQVWKRNGAEPAKKRAPPIRSDSGGALSGFAESTEAELLIQNEKRMSMLDDAHKAFEHTTAAFISRRIQNGGPRSFRGVERDALNSLRKRSGLVRRAMMAFL